MLSSGAAAPLTGRNRARAYIICIAVQRRNRRADGGLQPVTIVALLKVLKYRYSCISIVQYELLDSNARSAGPSLEPHLLIGGRCSARMDGC